MLRMVLSHMLTTLAVWLILSSYFPLGSSVKSSSTSSSGHKLLRSPNTPRLPNCHKFNSTKFSKTTKLKLLMCSLFKDEEGFLSEFVAYYMMHGFDKIILWNHGSVDNFAEELAPWTITGDVEVRNTSTLDDHPIVVRNRHPRQTKYWRHMSMKKALESTCLSYGIRHGFDFYASPDIDEYIVPSQNNRNSWDNVGDTALVPLANVLDDIFPEPAYSSLQQQDGMDNVPPPKFFVPVWKYNFNAAPHVLEPVDQLTIEAFSQRYAKPMRMSYYAGTAYKYLYRINVFGSEHSAAKAPNRTMAQRPEDNHIDPTRSFSDMQIFVSQCCYFHGCFDVVRQPDLLCARLRPAMEQYYVHDIMSASRTRSKSRYWLKMHHYARSAEKFALKALTWETANQEGGKYELSHYMGRTYGWTYDPSAVPFSCFVRREINRRRNAYIRLLSSIRDKVQQRGRGRGTAGAAAMRAALVSARGGGRSTVFAPANYSNHQDVDLALLDSLGSPSLDPYAYHRPGRNWLRNPEFGRPAPVQMVSALLAHWNNFETQPAAARNHFDMGFGNGGGSDVAKFHDLDAATGTSSHHLRSLREFGAGEGIGAAGSNRSAAAAATAASISGRLNELASPQSRFFHVNMLYQRAAAAAAAAAVTPEASAGAQQQQLPFLEFYEMAPAA